jgi:aspartate-semialdehyde dehydrogenase
MSSDVTVGVVGATGAVGKEFLEVLHGVKWRPRRVRAFASPGTATPFVTYGEDNVSVDDLGALDAGDLDALVLAAPREPSRVAGELALEAGIPIIDLGGAFRGEPDVPMCIPWINPAVLGQLGSRTIVCLPDSNAILLASVLAPLAAAGVTGHAHATVMVPASTWGRAGIDELSRQVVSLFNAGSPPRKVFPQGLAFDLLPAVGTLVDDGWTDLEHQAVAQVAGFVGERITLSMTLVAVPLFSGLSADISIRSVRRLLPDLALRILEDGGVRVTEEGGVRQLPRPRKVEGQPYVHVARTRTSQDGATFHIWATMDNLRTAAAAGVGLLGAALRGGRD